jgi:hypothetical protein
MDRDQYCRDVETYLCRKNDGHLIRIVGPAFELVCGWAERGIPAKIVRHGIDRYFDRYYAKGPRRRPVRIDFCEADVLDAFDEWRRAVGVFLERAGGHAGHAHQADETDHADHSDRAGHSDGRLPVKPRHSLVTHIDGVIGRLVARQSNPATPDLDGEVARVIEELESVRDVAATARGAARAKLVEQLAGLDRALAEAARKSCSDEFGAASAEEAANDLEPFRERMETAVYLEAVDAATDRALREKLGLPRIAYG